MRIQLPTGTPAEIHRNAEAELGLVLLPDIMGLRPLFDDLTRTLATRLKATVCAPEPFPGHEQSPLEDRHGIVAGFSDAEKLDDALAAADATECDRVSVLGFCMGGMYSLKASASPRFERVVSFYGMIRTPDGWKAEGTPSGNRDAIECVSDRDAGTVLAHIGSEDGWTPSVEVRELEALGANVVVYAGADHGFVHDPDRPTHRPDDAASAWAATDEFLLR